MKKQISSIVVFLCLGALCWAQTARTELFDAKKSQQELEIMKGILATTLNFVAQEVQKPAAGTRAEGRLAYSWGGGMFRPSAFYLVGQGAVFVIPASSLRVPGMVGSAFNLLAAGDFERATMQTSRELQQASREMELLSERMARQAGERRGVTPPPQPGQAAKPGTPPPATGAPAPPAPPQVNQEELRKKLAEAQERVKKVREETEANRARFMEILAQVKSYLIEALANHGDSLTTVKPSEYINLVIMTDDNDGRFGWDEGAGRAGHEVISVQKSWISDYKAGRLTIEAFKQKALQYNE